jgi:hypothetical protein
MIILTHIAIAWSEKGINPKDIPDGSFKFVKLASGHVDDDDKGKTFLSWGFLELEENQMKRAKNASSMHMVFHVSSGAVEIKVHENILTVRRGGVFQVPRGKFNLCYFLIVWFTTLLVKISNGYDGSDFVLSPCTLFDGACNRLHVLMLPCAMSCARLARRISCDLSTNTTCPLRSLLSIPTSWPPHSYSAWFCKISRSRDFSSY